MPGMLTSVLTITTWQAGAQDGGQLGLVLDGGHPRRGEAIGKRRAQLLLAEVAAYGDKRPESVLTVTIDAHGHRDGPAPFSAACCKTGMPSGAHRGSWWQKCGSRVQRG